VVAEAQVGDYFGAHHAGDIRGSGDAAAGGDFFRDAAAADDFATLEYEGGETGTGEVGGRSQAVVTTADYDRIIDLGWLDFFPLNSGRLGHRMTCDHEIRLEESYITASH
jgi:hypothetical protein